MFGIQSAIVWSWKPSESDSELSMMRLTTEVLTVSRHQQMLLR